MKNETSEFKKSPVLPELAPGPDHLGRETVIAILLGLLPIIAVAIFIATGAGREAESTAPSVNEAAVVAEPDASIGSAEAAEQLGYQWRSAKEAQRHLQQGPFESSGSVRSLSGRAASYEASNFKLEEDRAGGVEQKLVWMVESNAIGADAGDKLELYPDRQMEE